MGQILTAGTGQNPARQAAVEAGIPVEKTAYQINQLCGSGLRTVALGYQAIRLGHSPAVVTRRQESLRHAHHSANLRIRASMRTFYMAHQQLKSRFWDGFTDY